MRVNKELHREKLEALKRELVVGIDQLERSEFYELGSAKELFDHIKAEVHKRQKQKRENVDG